MFITEEGKLQSDEPINYEVMSRKSKRRQKKQIKKGKTDYERDIFKVRL